MSEIRTLDRPRAVISDQLSATNPNAARVAVLQVSIWPSRVSMLEGLAHCVGELRVFISTATEANRLWEPATGSLNVLVQRTISMSSYWRHPLGFREKQRLRFPIDTYNQLSRFRPHVVLSLELGFRTLMASLFRACHRDTRLIFLVHMTEHQQMGWRPVRTLLRKLLIRRADAVVANGGSAKRYMVGLGYPEKRIFVVPTVCDLEPFLSVPLAAPKPGPRRLLYVGRLVEGKGLLEFIARLDAFAQLTPEARVALDIYGYGPLEGSLTTATCSRNLHVVYKGRLSLCERPTAYASADVFVFPTLSDEWGLVVNEAMASGLPVLGSKYSQAVEELVEDGKSGWTFAPDREHEVDAAIRRALETPMEAIALMGRVARQAVRRVLPERGAAGMYEAIKHVMTQ